MKKLLLILICLVFIFSQAQAGDSLGFFKQELDFRLGTATNPSFPDSVKTKFINDAIDWVVSQIQNQAPCIEKLDTVFLAVGTIQYDLNADIVKRCLRGAVEIRSRYPAYEYVPLYDFGKSSPSTGASNSYKITQFGSKALFDPRPSKADTVLIFYNAKATRLASDTAHTLVPDNFNELIIRFAMGLCYDRINEKDDGNREYSFADQLLKQIIQILQNQNYTVTVAPKVQ